MEKIGKQKWKHPLLWQRQMGMVYKHYAEETKHYKFKICVWFFFYWTLFHITCMIKARPISIYKIPKKKKEQNWSDRGSKIIDFENIDHDAYNLARSSEKAFLMTSLLSLRAAVTRLDSGVHRVESNLIFAGISNFSRRAFFASYKLVESKRCGNGKKQ